MKFFFKVLLVLCFSLCFSQPIFANPAVKGGISTELKQFDNWVAYRLVDGEKKTCYIGSFPLDNSGKMTKKSGNSYVLVSAFKRGDEINISTSAKPSKGGIGIKIDKNNKVQLYSDGSMAWAADSATDDLLVALMQKGSSMSVVTATASGDFIQKYSLIGFSAAYKHMRSCSSSK